MDLSQKLQMTVQPASVSLKIKQQLKLCKVKPSVVYQQSHVYQFKCDLSADVGYARRHLH